jgi:predicted nucleotidyltransferase
MMFPNGILALHTEQHMNIILEQHKATIASLCRHYGVSRLEVFGSATRHDFDPTSSDFDFVIDFADYGRGVARRFMDFGDALEALLERRVDLVFEERMKPRFREAVDETREVVFEQGDFPPTSAWRTLFVAAMQ